MTGRRSTDDLIRDLAGRPLPLPPASGATVGAMLAAMAVGLGAFWLIFGLRPDLAAALGLLPVLAKSLLPLALCALALGLALASTRPEARPRVWPLIVVPLLGAGLVWQRLAALQGAGLWSEMIGQTAASCLAAITGLSLLPLGAGLMLLRRGAPARPALSGALLGLASGAGIAAGYALHCTEDSPLFFVTWYGLAIALAAGVGAIAGQRLLRW